MELADRKALGAFYTPPEVARYLCHWAIRSQMDRVLEPSCGDAEFLIAATKRIQELDGCLFDVRPSLTGVEINPSAVCAASNRLSSAGYSAEIHVCDFFDFMPDERFDCIVGNPPYIRYQQFSGDSRAKALRSALSVGVPLNGLASSWAPFVVHCSRLLTKNGRLALVLPAELLTVKYASPVREFLLRRFSRIQMILFEQRVFANAQEEVVLLLAEGSGRTKHFEVLPATTVESLTAVSSEHWREFDPTQSEKWSAALLPRSHQDTYSDAIERSGFVTLTDWGKTYLGAVTGNNNYFAMRASDVDAAGLRLRDLRRISPPGSKHLRSTAFLGKAWTGLAERDERCYLFYPQDRISRAASRYIADGEKTGVPEAYKCTVRDPWWRVPLVARADLFLTYMDSERPRLVRNAARVDHLNSLYGIRLRTSTRRLAAMLPIASVNSLTTLGAEIVGRSYGGGVLKLEPREADLLPLPAPSVVQSSQDELRGVEPQVSALAAQGRLRDACEIVDSILFPKSKATIAWLKEVREVRALLRDRRRARAKGNGAN